MRRLLGKVCIVLSLEDRLDERGVRQEQLAVEDFVHDCKALLVAKEVRAEGGDVLQTANVER